MLCCVVCVRGTYGCGGGCGGVAQFSLVGLWCSLSLSLPPERERAVVLLFMAFLQMNMHAAAAGEEATTAAAAAATHNPILQLHFLPLARLRNVRA